MHPSMSYRITTLEIEQAAVRAERARLVAEHPDQIVRHESLVRRALRALADRRTAAAPAPEIAPVAAPMPVAMSAQENRAQDGRAHGDRAHEDHAGELVVCAPHVA